MDIIVGVSMVIALGFIVLYVKDYFLKDASKPLDENEDETFCDIDLDLLRKKNDTSSTKDVNALKEKIQSFMQRNRFYKMQEESTYENT